MAYRDIVECIKLNQIKQNISVNTLAKRVNVTPQVITDIRGYRLKVSEKLFDLILKELSIKDITESEKKELLENQQIAQMNKHKKYIKNKNRKVE